LTENMGRETEAYWIWQADYSPPTLTRPL